MSTRTALSLALVCLIAEAFIWHQRRSGLQHARAMVEPASAVVSRAISAPSTNSASERSERNPDAATALSSEDRRLVGVMTSWLERAESIQAIFVQHPDLATPELSLLSADDWFLLAQGRTLDSKTAVADVAARARQSAENLAATRVKSALMSYLSSHDDRLPERVAELADYCSPPLAPEIFSRFSMARTGVLDRKVRGDVIVKTAPVDADRDRVWHVTTSGYNSEPAANYAVREAQAAYAQAHDGAVATTFDDLSGQLKWQTSRELVERILKNASAPKK